MKTVSKCLACMKGGWNPEFEPSVERNHGLWGQGQALSQRVKTWEWPKDEAKQPLKI